jgi:hypothetical protein
MPRPDDADADTDTDTDTDTDRDIDAICRPTRSSSSRGHAPPPTLSP